MHRSRSTLAVLTAALALTVGTAAITVAVAPARDAPSVPAATQLVARDAPSVRAATQLVARDAGAALPPSYPVAIDIPAIGVRSPLQQVGLTDERTMQVPAPGPLYDEAAWYKHSVGPGSPGAAIIVGHVDSASEGPSVFFDLAHLRAGDEILVARADGLTARFSVDTVGRYPKADFPTALVYGETDRPVLRLITCGGAFDGAAGHYVDNVVVFATLVDHREDADEPPRDGVQPY